jgi:hypothetical protein
MKEFFVAQRDLLEIQLPRRRYADAAPILS